MFSLISKQHYETYLMTSVPEAPLAQLVEAPLNRKVADFESHQGRNVVSLSKTLHLHCFVLVQPKKNVQT